MPDATSVVGQQPRDAAARRPVVLLAALVALGATVLASLTFGSHRLGIGETWHLLLSPDGSTASDVLHGLRLPRTVVAGVVGAALALAGSVLQTLTRNPLADPGILGINAGASLAVVLAVAISGVSGIGFYLWFALLGAAIAATAVLVLSGSRTGVHNPARIALAGVAVSAALAALTQTVILADQEAFNEFRFWVTGSLEGRGWHELAVTAPLFVLGTVAALAMAPALNALALGDDTARGLGVDVARVRTGGLIAAVLLAGGATAAVGPIGFVGLAVPLLARALVGHDQRWIAAVSLVLGAAWLLAADTLARVILVPSEVQVGVIAALAGAPVFIAIVRRRKVPSL
ncbi:FecCD family ABC transporter permease [Nocardioides sp. Kera G14]|uniref:FecCD family ABC transporter permease n=1 Tax=Nocardioides sp. Kera G14 TaxID=2884264 RepID=UPI001D109AD9|nr:iron ABC transporter permease [Nocardioides sp. Kera G14]UDY24274.1 iron ABC transporter permease [Nocardioides sp. Kera G14]